MRNVAIIQLNLSHTKDAIIKLQEERIIEIKTWIGFISQKSSYVTDYIENINVDLLMKEVMYCDDESYV